MKLIWVLTGLGLVLLVVCAVVVAGRWQWQRQTLALRGGLIAAPTATDAGVRFDVQVLQRLPLPVQRYLLAVLKPGQRMVQRVQISHDGLFSMSENQTEWTRFTSNQLVSTRPIGFDWDGRIRMAPGVDVFVHDAYVGGEGLLRARLLGLLALADLRGTREIGAGELMRYLAESPWYPTAWLPGQGIVWEGIDANSARGTLLDNGLKVSLDFHFDEQGLVDTVYAVARSRTVQGKTVPTPWQGRFWNYELRGGVLVPTEGEVAWLLPQGRLPYWRGTLRSLRYEFAQP